MKVSNVVVAIVTENTNVPIKSVTTMEVLNIGDVTALVNRVTLKAGERKTLIVADGTVSDTSLEVVFSEDFAALAYVRKIEIIYKKLVQC
jgi:hypothetical protein